MFRHAEPNEPTVKRSWVKFSWLRSSRVWGDLTECMVRASDCQCQSRNSPWVQSQHTPTQMNLNELNEVMFNTIVPKKLSQKVKP